MSRSLFSSSWYRVADLRPRLRSHLQIYRQRFRDETWYILQDQQAGQYHRVTPAAHLMLSLMNGRRTMQEIWASLAAKLGKDQPTQDECIQLLAQLHMADLLSSNVTPDLAELDKRSRKVRTRQMLMRVKNPMALRFPLLDPDRFLERTLWLVRPAFSVAGLVLWLALVLAGGVIAVMHWSALTHNLADRVLTAENVILIVLIYPVVKAIHELGHGYAVKRWGGEVHEIGIMLLVLMPVPYVDASSSLAFAERYRRVVVGAAGIMVELTLAALAMIVWLNVEDGWVRATAFNVMLISGASTLLFNGNPLLRFDGYYVLCDLIESPNLGTRANRYIFYLLQRHVLGISDAEPPAIARGERKWLLFYAVASFLYRVAVVIGIALFIATKFFFIGIALAIWCVAALLLLPLVRGLRFLATSPKLRNRRSRAVGSAGLAVAAVAVLLFAVPVPYATVAQGVVWTEPRTQVRVLTEGRIDAVHAEPNAVVAAGQPLIRMSNPDLHAELRQLEAERRAFAARLAANMPIDQVQVRLLELQVENIDAAMTTLRQRIEDLTIAAAVDGRFLLPSADALPGRYLAQGQQLGVIAPLADPIVRVVVEQDDLDLVRTRTERAELRLAHLPGRVREAHVVGSSPSALDRLPSRALSQSAGGAILADPTDPEGLRPLRDVFQFDLRLREPAIEAPIGQRAWVRFDHGSEPVFWRLWRGTRQLLLRMFDV